MPTVINDESNLQHRIIRQCLLIIVFLSASFASQNALDLILL